MISLSTNERRTSPERVGERGEPVDDLSIRVSDDSLSELMFSVIAEVQDAADLEDSRVTLPGC